MRSVLEFISLISVGLSVGVVLSHVLKSTNKARLPAGGFLMSQQVLLANWQVSVGSIEALALVSTLGATVIRIQQDGSAFASVLASALLILMFVVWLIWIRPINKAVNAWTVDSIPSDWKTTRDRWERLHAVRCVCGLLAFGLLALT